MNLSLFDPALQLTCREAVVIVIGYGFLLLTSGVVVNGALRFAGASANGDDQTMRVGFVLGKCENILVLTFLLLGEFTALALIFAAESLVTRESDSENFTSYVLVGTLVNFTYSITISILVMIVLQVL